MYFDPVGFLAREEGDRFDLAEGLNVLAHDYGLYAVKTALDRAGFRAGPTRETLDGIEGAGREVFRRLAPLAEAWNDPYTVPYWADAVLAVIRNDEGEDA